MPSPPLMMPKSPIVGTALLPQGTLCRAVVHVAKGRIEGIEREPSPVIERALRRDGRGHHLSRREVLAPAFIDVHCHGAGGGTAAAGAASLQVMSATLLRHGVAAFLAALMTAPIAELIAAASTAADAPGAWGGGSTPLSTLLGLHFEGPALSPEWSAGHDPSALVTPADLSRSLAEAAEAWRAVRIVTLAPELDGGLELIGSLARAGIVSSVGHTGASADVAIAAYGAGARSTTHLFNGMPPLHHRTPGPIGAALAAAPFIELICDGVHVDARLLPSLARAVGDDRLILVSDALPLAGSRLRSIPMPGSSAHIRGGRAVHPDGTLAGSRLLLDGMVSEAVRSGIPLAVVLRGATENPARLLELTDRGTITPGAVADFVVVSRGGRLRKVLAAGVSPPGTPA